MPNIAIKLKANAERILKKGHPWIFETSIVKQSAEGQAGDICIIFDHKKNSYLGLGLYDPLSPIRIKVIAVHKKVRLSEAWFEQEFRAAKAIRTPLLETDTNSYRLIHGENDGFPSLIADVYNNVLVIKLYAAIWLPYFQAILTSLIKVAEVETVVLRLSRQLQQRPDLLGALSDGQVVHGTLEEEEIVFREHGIRFSANVIKGHKTGYFLDHRANRKRIGTLAKGKRVLDVFAYAGGFSVHALVGGAREVTSLDISKHALAIAQQNVALNEVSGQHEILCGDAFKLLEQLYKNGETFDIVVVDPPTFAKQTSEIDTAIHQYRQLAQLAAPLVAANGILMLASCSSRVIADDFYRHAIQALRATGIAFQELDRTQHDIDHPIGFEEGAYLKSIYLKRD